MGPARTADGLLVTAGNVVDLTERANYVMYRDPVRRKAFLLDVARAAAGRMLGAVGMPGGVPPCCMACTKCWRAGR